MTTEVIKIGTVVFFKHDSNKTEFVVTWVNPKNDHYKEYLLNDGSYVRENEIKMKKS